MTQAPWRKVADLKIPAKPAHAALWTPALHLVAGPRLLRITVPYRTDEDKPIKDEWNIAHGNPCSANGMSDERSNAASGSLLAANAPKGALIGKLGGSSSDLAAGTPPAYKDARVFPVGSFAVIKIGADELGPLFFTMNDTQAGFPNHSGELHVVLEEMDL